MGYILHCFKCLHREVLREDLFNASIECPECDSDLKVAGPLWLGKMGDSSFCRSIQIEATKSDLKNKYRMIKLLSTIQNELKAPETYYVTDNLCDKLNLPTPRVESVIKTLRLDGFEAIPTHFNSKGVKTNASAKDITKIIVQLVNKP
jgi:tRNA (guanine26-N2/guanine27-N2)-dimethyltransferase